MGYIWSCCSAKDWCWHLGKTTKEGRRERVGVSRGRRESETEREQGRGGEGEGENKPGTQNLWKAAPYSQNLSVTPLHPPLYNVPYTTQKDLQDVTPRADAFECFTRHCSKLGTIRMPRSRRRRGQTVVYSQDGVLLSTSKERTAGTHSHVRETRSPRTEQKVQKYILYDSIEVQGRAKPISSDGNHSSVLEGAWGLIWKGQKGTFWGDGSILFLDGDVMWVCTFVKPQTVYLTID